MEASSLVNISILSVESITCFGLGHAGICFTSRFFTFSSLICAVSYADPSETPMIGGPPDHTRSLSSFELRCPRGTFIVAVSGIASTGVQSIGPLTCSDGTGTPLESFRSQSGSTFTTAIAPDGFTGMTVTADWNVASLEFIRKDGVLSVTYGKFADYTSQNGRRQFLTCPSFGVATGIVGIKAPDGTPVMLGFLCSGLPCSVRQDTMFGPAGAGQLPNSPAGYLQNSPEPTTTTTATQCCGACTHDFKCQFWVRENSTGNCWLVYREPTEPGRGIPADWAFQSVPGYQSGTTQPKTSGECKQNGQQLHAQIPQDGHMTTIQVA